MNNIIIIAYFICVLLIFIPLFIYRNACPSNELYKQIDLPKKTFTYINAITYVLIGLSVFLVITSDNTHSGIYWLTLWGIISMQIVHYMYLFNVLYQNQVNIMLLIIYTVLLSLVLLSSYYINPISGILLSPVLVWNSYLLIQFKNSRV